MITMKNIIPVFRFLFDMNFGRLKLLIRILTFYQDKLEIYILLIHISWQGNMAFKLTH